MVSYEFEVMDKCSECNNKIKCKAIESDFVEVIFNQYRICCGEPNKAKVNAVVKIIGTYSDGKLLCNKCQSISKGEEKETNW